MIGGHNFFDQSKKKWSNNIQKYSKDRNWSRR